MFGEMRTQMKHHGTYSFTTPVRNVLPLNPDSAVFGHVVPLHLPSLLNVPHPVLVQPTSCLPGSCAFLS